MKSFKCWKSHNNWLPLGVARECRGWRGPKHIHTQHHFPYLSLWGESLRESYESPYCIPGPDVSVQPQWAALLAMHAGLLHLLVPTELDSPPDWQSEFMLSVRSMLHVCSSCLQVWALAEWVGKVTIALKRQEETEEEWTLGEKRPQKIYCIYVAIKRSTEHQVIALMETVHQIDCVTWIASATDSIDSQQPAVHLYTVWLHMCDKTKQRQLVMRGKPP